MTNIVLASHGELAKGIYNTAKMIIGEFDCHVEVFCLYPGQNPIDFAENLKSKILKSKDTWIIICDILGGSVHTALSQLTKCGNVIIFSGMNLNLVLEILLDKSNDFSEKHMNDIVEQACLGITCKNKLTIQKNDEF